MTRDNDQTNQREKEVRGPAKRVLVSDGRTAHKRYPSKYGRANGFVTAAQYLAQFICGRQAQRAGRTLPLDFWTLPAWKAIYTREVVAANKLVKRIDPADTGKGCTAIMKVLKSKRGSNVLSLMAPFLVPLIDHAHSLLVGLSGL